MSTTNPTGATVVAPIPTRLLSQAHAVSYRLGLARGEQMVAAARIQLGDDPQAFAECLAELCRAADEATNDTGLPARARARWCGIYDCVEGYRTDGMEAS